MLRYYLFFLSFILAVKISNAQIVVSLHPEKRKDDAIEYITQQINKYLSPVKTTYWDGYSKTRKNNESYSVVVHDQIITEIEVRNLFYDATSTRAGRNDSSIYITTLNLNNIISYEMQEKWIKLNSLPAQVSISIHYIYHHDDMSEDNEGGSNKTDNFMTFMCMGETNSPLRAKFLKALDSLIASNLENRSK